MSTGLRSLLAFKDAGFISIGAVVGAAVYQVVTPQGCRSNVRANYPEGDQLVYSMYEDTIEKAWNDAISRLREDARRVHAHGVVGVIPKAKWTGGQPGMLEVTLIGTAVRADNEAALEDPFVSMLPIDDTLKLLLGGWIPTGIGVGIAAVHVHYRHVSGLLLGRPFSNVELTNASASLQFARDRAEARLRSGHHLGAAQGVIGTSFSLERQKEPCWSGEGLKLEGQMFGTGIVRVSALAAPIDAVLRMTKDLTDD